MIITTNWNELDRVVGDGFRIVFTNGCFDPLRAHHVRLLEDASSIALKYGPHGLLIVGVNTDESVERLKGYGHPLMPLEERMRIIDAVRGVSFVVSFAEDTPIVLIKRLRPTLIIKGGDYRTETIVGHEYAPVSIFPLLNVTDFDDLLIPYITARIGGLIRRTRKDRIE